MSQHIDPEVKQSFIVDDLTTNDAGKALSAKQGKVLDNKITDINTCENLGNMASQSALETALNNTLSGMAVNTNKAIQIACTSSFGAFSGATTYNAMISKGGASNNYATVLFESINGTGNAIIKATKNQSWRFEGLALNSNKTTYYRQVSNIQKSSSITVSFTTVGIITGRSYLITGLGANGLWRLAGILFVRGSNSYFHKIYGNLLDATASDSALTVSNLNADFAQDITIEIIGSN